ncbi:hypothetical protein MJD09_22790 [bacterium]|nr:hypothetical protein [bacterium]
MTITSRMFVKVKPTKTLILSSYLLITSLTPYFHAHPEEDHPEVSGNLYHSHTEPFAHSHEDEDDDENRPEPQNVSFHFFVGSNSALTDYLSSTEYRTICEHQTRTAGVKPDVAFANQKCGSADFEFLDLPPPAERCLPLATDLSPPVS